MALRRALVLCWLWGCASAPPPIDNARAVAPAVAPAPRPVFMFSIDREGAPTSYLHGSVHVRKDGSDGQETVIDEAFESADALVVEVDTTAVEAQEMQVLTLQLGMYPPGDDLTQHIAPEAWESLLPILAKLGMPPDNVKIMRPWLLSITIGVLAMQQDGYSQEDGVDTRYLNAAHSREEAREVIPLETVEEQLRAMGELPDTVQALMLEDTVSRIDDTDYIENMFEAWRTGNVDGLADIVFQPLRDEPRLQPMYQALFFDRNRRMADRLSSLLATPKSYFVVVGAAHLAGPQSLPELLRERGYRVEQVRATATPTAMKTGTLLEQVRATATPTAMKTGTLQPAAAAPQP